MIFSVATPQSAGRSDSHSSPRSGGAVIPIVYAFPCKWSDVPARQRCMMEAISAHVPVYFLDYATTAGKRIGFRMPRAVRVSESVTVIHDAMGFRFTGLARRLGRLPGLIDGFLLQMLLRRLGVREYAYWLSTPDAGWLGGMRTDRLIYDCIDPCYGDADRARYDAEEAHVAGRSQIVFCSAECLTEKLRAIHPRVFQVENGCYNLRYHETSFAQPELPEPIRGAKRPLIGTIGTLDERVDMDLLIAAAKTHSDYTFVFVGRVNPDQAQAGGILSSLPNVIMAGQTGGELGRAYVAAFDAALIPFRQSPVYDGCNPVKMWMFLAEGKPVVTTWTRECRRYHPHVRATRDHEEFIDAIRDAVERDTLEAAAARIALAQRNTWADRAKQAYDLLVEHGIVRPPAPAGGRHREVGAG